MPNLIKIFSELSEIKHSEWRRKYTLYVFIS